MSTDRRRLLAAATAVAAVAVVARAPGALTYPLWQDEIASARILVEPTPWGAVARVADTESTPPAWYLVGWAIHHVGVPVEDVRWFSVLCGAAAAAIVVLFARRFLTLPGATLAGLVVALAWQLVSRGHELRAYSLLLLLAAAFGLVLARAARAPSLGRLAAVAAVTALGLLTHYFFALLAAAGLAWLALVPPERRRGAALAIAAGAVPLLAWLPGFLQQVENERYSWVASFDLLKAAAVYSTFVWNADELYVDAQAVSIPAADAVARLAILALVASGAVLLWRLGLEARLAALAATLPVAAASLLWLSGGAIFTTRNLVVAAPFAAVAVAAAIVRLPAVAAVPAGLAVVFLLGLGLVQERTLRPPPYPAYADRLVTAGWTVDDPVYVLGGAHRLSYLGSAYALRSPIGWYLPGRPFLRLAEETCDRPFYVVDGAARPVAIARGRCPVPPGGFWFSAD